MEIIYLKKTKIKICLYFLTILLTLGLILLFFRWYPKLLSLVSFSDSLKDEATHLFVQDQNTSALVDIFQASEFGAIEGGRRIGKVGNLRCFIFKEIRYRLTDLSFEQVHLKYYPLLDNLEIQRDLIEDREGMLGSFGPGAIQIPQPSNLQLLERQILKPFYSYIVFTQAVWCYNKQFQYAAVIFLTTLITIFINFYSLKLFFKKLVEISNFRIELELANGRSISNNSIVPGDIVALKEGRIAFDGVLVQGTILVNQSCLTGQSTPVFKKPHEKNQPISSQSLMSQGTEVIGVWNKPMALVTKTGFSTTRGQLISSIKDDSQQIDLQRQTNVYLFINIMIVTVSYILIFFVFKPELFDQEDRYMNFLDAFSIAVPPALASCITSGIIFAKEKLEALNIFSISPSRISEGGKVTRVCFDKTGTLTKIDMTLRQILNSSFQQVEDQRILWAMSLCHNLTQFKGKIIGDSMQVQCFLRAGAKFIDQKGNFLLQDQSQARVLKLFEFDNDLFRMSVTVQIKGKKYVICKGSQEILKGLFVDAPNDYSAKMQSLAIKGLRVLAVGIKEIDFPQQRQLAQTGLSFLGVFVFQNMLKQTSKATIDQLQACGLSCCIITGDNPLTAAAVGESLGLMHSQDQIKLIDQDIGQKVLKNPGSNRLSLIVRGQSDHFLERFRDSDTLPLVKIWSRMSPNSKSKVVKLYRQKGQAVMMVGDGANDAIALKAANIGLSLAEGQISIAGHFMSNIFEPRSAISLLRQCRAGLSVSIAIFKAVIVYSLVQYLVTVDYYLHSEQISKNYYLFQDVVFNLLPLLILPYSITNSNLTACTPPVSLLSGNIFLSIFLIIANYQLISFWLNYWLASRSKEAIDFTLYLISNCIIGTYLVSCNWTRPWRTRSQWPFLLYIPVVFFVPLISLWYDLQFLEDLDSTDIGCLGVLISLANSLLIYIIEGEFMLIGHIGWKQYRKHYLGC